LYAFTQAREDLARYSEGLTAEQLWTSMVGFHIRHIARSTERLVGYLEGGCRNNWEMEIRARRARSCWRN
jgi:hypothetical protein